MVKRECENCHKVFELRLSDANRGRGRFCGKSCAASGRFNSSYKHGGATRHKMTKEYRTWVGIRKRTLDDNAQNYKYYGGHGIKMCDRWQKSFANFLEDMGHAPSDEYSIDRIDNNGNYEPSNCRWATTIQQMSNTHQNKILTLDGLSMTQEAWGRLTGIGGTNICKRLGRGWDLERALHMPLIKR